MHVTPEVQQPVYTVQMAAFWWHRAALGLVTIALVPPAEEVLFRGILYPFVKQLGHPRLALWGTSVVFAVIHLNAVTLLPLTVLALVLTLLYERTDNLVAPVAAHALFNALNFAVLCLSSDWGHPASLTGF